MKKERKKKKKKRNFMKLGKFAISPQIPTFGTSGIR
jgi:hypothetical protein